MNSIGRSSFNRALTEISNKWSLDKRNSVVYVSHDAMSSECLDEIFYVSYRKCGSLTTLNLVCVIENSFYFQFILFFYIKQYTTVNIESGRIKKFLQKCCMKYEWHPIKIYLIRECKGIEKSFSPILIEEGNSNEWRSCQVNNNLSASNGR